MLGLWAGFAISPINEARLQKSSGSAVTTESNGGHLPGIRGNFVPPGEQIEVARLNVRESIDELITEDSIELDSRNWFGRRDGIPTPLGNAW